MRGRLPILLMVMLLVVPFAGATGGAVSATEDTEDPPREGHSLPVTGDHCVVVFFTMCYPLTGTLTFVETEETIRVVLNDLHVIHMYAFVTHADCTYDKALPINDPASYTGSVAEEGCHSFELDRAWLPAGEGPLCQVSLTLWGDWVTYLTLDAAGPCS